MPYSQTYGSMGKFCSATAGCDLTVNGYLACMAELTTEYQLTGHILRVNQEIVKLASREDVKTDRLS